MDTLDVPIQYVHGRLRAGIVHVVPSAVDELLTHSSGPLVDALSPVRLGGSSELGAMLTGRNGFYAFESALHVSPSTTAGAEHGGDAWNAPGLWRDAYGTISEQQWFFAEDVFGGQFAVGPAGVSVFDPETGSSKPMASSLEAWARAILDDYAMLTGFPLAHEWQATNGPLRAGRRLLPTIPFVMGGGYTVDNLRDVESVEAMRHRAAIAVQIRDLPDGSKVRLRIVE
jgi:hypothetical protein